MKKSELVQLIENKVRKTLNESSFDKNKYKIYPELDSIVDRIFDKAIDDINKLTKNVKSEMPYKTQYVLEELIKKLENKV